jgi:hypothetical protein
VQRDLCFCQLALESLRDLVVLRQEPRSISTSVTWVPIAAKNNAQLGADTPPPSTASRFG